VLVGFGGYTQAAGYVTGANIQAVSEQVWSNTGRGTSLRFQTTQIGTTARIEKLRISDNGFVGIGVPSPTAQLHTIGSVRFAGMGAGTLTTDVGGNVTPVSDEKFKTNIKPLKSNNKAPTTTAIQKIKALNPVCWNYNVKSGLDTANQYCGWIAQEVELVIPEAVYTKDEVQYEMRKDKDGNDITIETKTGEKTKSIDDRPIIDTMILAMQEQQATIEAQQKQIDELKARIEKLEK